MNAVTFSTVDAHVHCGILDRFPPQGLDDYRAQARGSGIVGAVVFSPVMEIYDRYDPHFSDPPEWQARRRESNTYLLSLESPAFEVFPFFFIWNDFAVEDLTPRHKGIKWHRHADEPTYRYGDPRCARAIEEIRRRRLPVVLEEELYNTERFIRELAMGVRVIIPHMGGLNGGYRSIKRLGLWENPDVYGDTALASPQEVMDYVENYGHERLLFGSDFPFGHPRREMEKVLGLPLSTEVKEAVLQKNVRRLLGDVYPSAH